jgi:regulator of sigma E protease
VNLFFSPVNMIAFVFLLGLLIFIHEFGHFFVAKLLGIHVEVFSLGFGPRLFGWRRNGSDYRVSLLPLGGYVKMLGEHPNEELRGSPREFLSRTKWERFFVLVMGATLNIILAVVIMAGVYMHGIPAPKYTEEAAMVGTVEKGSPAEAAGLRPMDTILSVGETDVPTWSEMHIAVALHPGKRLPFRILRDGSEMVIHIEIGKTRREAMGQIGVAAWIRAMVITDVREDGPAAAAGLREGDLLLQTDGMEIGSNLEATTRAIFQNKGTTVALKVRRDEEEFETSILPEPLAEGRSDPGLNLRIETIFKKYPLLQAFVESGRWNMRFAGLLFSTLKGLVAGQLSLRTLSGPIEIYKYTGQAWKGGAVAYFSFMALVSLQLGIVNLLPIPVLDGGHVFILFLEGILRRDLSLMVKERMMQVGLVLLLLLMGTVISLDFYKHFTG